MKHYRSLRHACFQVGMAVALSVSSEPAIANDSNGIRIVTIGVGPQISPKYLGDEELRLSVLPIFRVRREGDPLPFAAPDQGTGFGLAGSGSVFDFGPAMQLRSERDVQELGLPKAANVDASVELGAFAELYAAPWLRLRIEGRRAITGHESWSGDASIDLVHRSASTVLSVGPRLRFSDDRFQRIYFDAAAGQTPTSRLTPYEPDGGLYAAGVTTTIFHQFNDRWGISGYARYDRLIAGVEDSPFIREFGSADQFFAGLGLHFSFHIGRE